MRCGEPLSTIARSLDRLGGRLDAHHLLGSKIFILLTVLVFAAQLYVGQTTSHQGALEALTGPMPRDAIRFGALRLDLLFAEPWRLVSAVFVHFGALHLVGNMLFLAWLGRIAEPAVGSARFAVVYIVSGVIGFAASMVYTGLVDPAAWGLTAGASGAVFGVMGLVLGMLYRQKNPQWKRFALQAVLINVLFGLGINQMRVGIMINNVAHIGGLVVGLGFGLIFAAPPRHRQQKPSELRMNITAVVGLLACVASLLLAQRSPAWRQSEAHPARSSGDVAQGAASDFATTR